MRRRAGALVGSGTKRAREATPIGPHSPPHEDPPLELHTSPRPAADADQLDCHDHPPTAIYDRETHERPAVYDHAAEADDWPVHPTWHPDPVVPNVEPRAVLPVEPETVPPVQPLAEAPVTDADAPGRRPAERLPSITLPVRLYEPDLRLHTIHHTGQPADTSATGDGTSSRDPNGDHPNDRPRNTDGESPHADRARTRAAADEHIGG